MDLPTELIILIMAVLILAAVGYLQLRYIRSKKEARLAKDMELDDAYNAVATTKAVADSLRQNGRDTTEADVLIYQAENAYDRREYSNCLNLCERAKTALRNSKQKDPISASAPVPQPKEEKEEKAKASTEVPSTQIKKLPPNYLESKFVIATVKETMEGASEPSTEARGMCDEAEECFRKGDYTEALRMAMKAKRCLASVPKPDGQSTAAEVSASPVDKPEEVVPTEAEARACSKCGAKMGPDDTFCGVCGTMIGERTCPSCSRKAEPEDVFCRKCGTKIDR